MCDSCNWECCLDFVVSLMYSESCNEIVLGSENYVMSGNRVCRTESRRLLNVGILRLPVRIMINVRLLSKTICFWKFRVGGKEARFDFLMGRALNAVHAPGISSTGWSEINIVKFNAPLYYFSTELFDVFYEKYFLYYNFAFKTIAVINNKVDFLRDYILLEHENYV